MSNTLNYGSMMMGENLINSMISRSPNPIHFYIDTQDQIHVHRLREATQYPHIFSDTQLNLNLYTKNIRVVRYFEKRLRNHEVMKRMRNFYQAIIILGGDDYAETYFTFPKDNLLFASIFKDIHTLSNIMPVMMLSQSIGPFSREREDLVSKSLENVRIFSRDPVSHAYVTDKLKLTSESSADLAFLNLSLEEALSNDQEKILKHYDLVKREYFVIVGTGLIEHYAHNIDLFARRFLDVLKRIHAHYPTMKLVYLSHVVNQDTIYNDGRLLTLLKKLDSEFIEQKMIQITTPLLPVEARMILGGSRLNVSCRMHAVVSSLHMNVPAIALSYSKKYRGVISEGMDLSELVIESKGDHIWTGPIDQEIVTKIKEILANEVKIKEKIREKVEINIQKATKMMDLVVSELKK